MSDSSENDEMFGGDSDEDGNDVEAKDRAQAKEKAPAYVNQPDFKEFVNKNQINLSM